MNKKNTIRRQIQLQSLPLFVRYGYHGVTMDQIAEAVGIAKSTIYYSHFKGKLELIKSILVTNLSENKSFWQLLFRSMGEPDVSEVIKEKYEEIYEQIKDLTTLLYTQSGTADPGKRAILLLATIDGLMYQSLFFDRISNLEETKDYLIDYYKI
ncbi:MAG: TetR/AcrR family transcriptional regulator [Candidatus Kariarchaeaceae archaeon]|jgi:AcrR family transcriptional regulator